MTICQSCTCRVSTNIFYSTTVKHQLHSTTVKHQFRSTTNTRSTPQFKHQFYSTTVSHQFYSTTVKHQFHSTTNTRSTPQQSNTSSTPQQSNTSSTPQQSSTSSTPQQSNISSQTYTHHLTKHVNLPVNLFSVSQGRCTANPGMRITPSHLPSSKLCSRDLKTCIPVLNELLPLAVVQRL